MCVCVFTLILRRHGFIFILLFIYFCLLGKSLGLGFSGVPFLYVILVLGKSVKPHGIFFPPFMW